MNAAAIGFHAVGVLANYAEVQETRAAIEQYLRDELNTSS
jgi:hypothetical protein